MTPVEVETLKNVLKERFDAEVEAEPVNDEGRYRIAVVSSRFESMPHLQRQDDLWEVVDETLPPRVTALGISLILAFAPSELVA